MALDSVASAKNGLFQQALTNDVVELNSNEIEFLVRLIASGFLISDGGIITLTQPPVFSAASLTSIPAPTTIAGLTLSGLLQGDLLYGSASATLAALVKDANATRYLSNTGTSNNPAWAQVNLANGVTGDLPFANLTQGSALSVLGVTGNGAADNASIAAGTDHQVLRRSGTAVAFGAVNLASADAVTGDLAYANLTQGSALSVLGVTGNATADVASIAAGSDKQVLRREGTAVAFGAVDLASASAVTGNLPVANLNSGTSASASTFWRGDGTWAAAGGSFTPRTLSATAFETSGRFTNTVVSGGTITYDTTSAMLDTSGTISSSAHVLMRMLNAANGGGVLTTFPGEFGCVFELNLIGTDSQMFLGLGAPTVGGAGITYTADHIGFKIVRAASGAISLFATVANGTTETASSALTTVATDDNLDLSLKVTSADSVSFWWRKNGSAWSSATEITTNIPTTTTIQQISFAASNAGVATQTRLRMSSAYYSR